MQITLFVILCLTTAGIISADTSISISPSTNIVSHGETFTIDVCMDPDVPIAAGQFDLIFDNSLVTVNSLTEGDLFRQAGAPVFFNEGIIDNSQGRISIVYGLLLDKSSIATAGTFATISLNASNSSGVCIFELLNVVVSNSTAYAVPINVINGSIVIEEHDTGDMDDGSDTFGGSGSGDGVGGAGNTGEDLSSIVVKEVSKVFVNRGHVSYPFEESENPLTYVNYTALTNAGSITTIVEVLNQASLFTNSSEPPGHVFKNINIWVGNYGYATENNMQDAVISFRVSRSWLDSNNISTPDVNVRMYRYHENKWLPLSTQQVGENDIELIFEARTPGFSPFAIVGQNTSDEPYVTGDDGEQAESDITFPVTDEASGTTESLGQNTLLILCLSILILLSGRRQ